MTEERNASHFLAETKFFEAYSRYLEEEKRYETWGESVGRVMDMHRQKYSHINDKEFLELLGEIEKSYRNRKILGAQRALQFGGEQILRHNLKIYNCLSSYADRPAFFGEAFYGLLCGCGVGFSVQKPHVDCLPKIIRRTKQPKIHVIEDSIEGWGTALDVLLSSFFEDGGVYPEYKGHRVCFDTSKIRQKNAKISGGFLAPGPDPLRLALDRIEHLLQGLTLEGEKKKAQLRPIHVYDIVMFASDAVLSGGVRRSATIAIFSFDDDEMMNAKTGDWWRHNPQRARSNNSALVLRNEITLKEFLALGEKIKQFGEPGFVFADTIDFCGNPCLEIGMYPQILREVKPQEFLKESGFQGCNLTELNGGGIKTEEDFYTACRLAAALGTLQAGYTDFKFMSNTTRQIFERESLIGVSITGWMARPDLLFNEDVLKKGAMIVRQTNEKVARMIGINPAARTTCVKPSGTASVILESPSGIHPEHSPRFFRNIQVPKDSEINRYMEEVNPYMVEESVWSSGRTDNVLSFPLVAKEGSLYKEDMLGTKMLDHVKKAQKFWVEEGTNYDLCAEPSIRHNVSNTIMVDDWDEVLNYIYENRVYFTGITLIPFIGDRVYAQAPFVKVRTFDEIVDKYGEGSIFASGLIVDGLKAFGDEWWYSFRMNEGDFDENSENVLKVDWIRRYFKFSENWFAGDHVKTEECLKDVYLLHKWFKVQQSMREIDWSEELEEKKFVGADTTAGAECSGGSVMGESSCVV